MLKQAPKSQWTKRTTRRVWSILRISINRIVGCRLMVRALNSGKDRKIQECCSTMHPRVSLRRAQWLETKSISQVAFLTRSSHRVPPVFLISSSKVMVISSPHRGRRRRSTAQAKRWASWWIAVYSRISTSRRSSMKVPEPLTLTPLRAEWVGSVMASAVTRKPWK